MWSDRLTLREKQQTERAIAKLSTVAWARPMLTRLHAAGGIKADTMPLMFEVRFAYELHRAGVTAEYEFAAGVGDSTIEFRLHTNPPWLVELVSIRPSEAAKRAIRKLGLIYEQLLTATPTDPGRSGSGEMITAEQKIGEKVFTNGRATKFPAPDGSLRLILTDIRGYLDQGGDALDYRQMAYGRRGVPRDLSPATQYWEMEAGGLTAIKGLFESTNPLRAARFVQERIHFLGFVREHDFVDSEITQISYYLANWHLFATEQEAANAYVTYPLVKNG